MIRLLKNIFILCTFITVSLTTMPAFGAVTVLDDFATGDFNIAYGSTGLAYVNPLLYAEGAGGTNDPVTIDGLTTLSYDYGKSGDGTSALTLTYMITNDDTSEWKDLRFMLRVQADGEQVNYLDTVARTWGANSGNEPDHYQVDVFEFDPDLREKIVTNNGLDDMDASESENPLDVDFALEWDLDTLGPGLQWVITVLLSDDGTTISPNRFLQATGVGSLDTVLTFSGTAGVVPIPGTVFLLGSGLMGLAGLRRRSGKN